MYASDRKEAIRMGKREKKRDKKHKGGGARVAIISRESNEKTLDVRMLEEELLRRGIKVITLSRLLTKDSYVKALGYIGHVIKQELCILRSDVVILDTYCIQGTPGASKTKHLLLPSFVILARGSRTDARVSDYGEKQAKPLPLDDGGGGRAHHFLV